MTTSLHHEPGTQQPPDLAVLESIQRRVLWLATAIIDHANRGRPNPDALKVGGHQASSASVVSILVALYFGFLRAGDRVAIKPHASPAYHAVQYLLGNLPREYLTTLRAYKGLQAYPSRTKDPDPVDFSTGSVGLGAVAPLFAAFAARYAGHHFEGVGGSRFVALVGDAELDEGSIWEAVAEEALRGLGNVLWIVDLNRQSLDRVIPGIRANQLKAQFAASGWHVIEAKYGRRLQAAFAGPDGRALRRRIDDMSNEEYQSLLRVPRADLRERLVGAEPDRDEIARAIASTSDDDLPDLVGDLGGHDLVELLAAFARADAMRDAPTVFFAYTIKGWKLPFAADPLNHAALLTPDQMGEVQSRLGIPPGAEWDAFPSGSPEAQACARAAARLRDPPAESARFLYGPFLSPSTLKGGRVVPRPDLTRPPFRVEGAENFPFRVEGRKTSPTSPTETGFTPAAGQAACVDARSIPSSLGRRPPAATSTQETFGRLLLDLAAVPGVGERVVTASPDVAVSTNLAGWINRVGVYAASTQPDYEAAQPRLVRWQPGPGGQHVELGISEMNLFMLLGQLGLSLELCGQHLLPIGTLYDPFICRGLDALIYSLYSGARMVFAGTPSGISLSHEGGAHQSLTTPSLGIELPGLRAYEPCFARELEWVLLEALRQCCDRATGESTYLRLSTVSVDQSLMDPALARLGEETLRTHVLAGGYRLVDHRFDAPETGGRHIVQLAAAGAVVPEAAKAARFLHREGVAANVLNLTSAGLLFRELAAARRLGREPAHLALLIPDEERRAPIVTVVDGASHALAFLGGVFGAPSAPLGVDDFGQSGSRPDLYRHYGIDASSIAAAAFELLGT